MFEILLLSGLLSSALSADIPEERAIKKEVAVEGSVEAVWQAWTTSSGLETFFGRHCRIEPRPEGVLEIWFDPEAPAGRRGAEGLMVLGVQPYKMLSFTWSAPPQFPDARRQRTSVVVRFKELGQNRSLVRLIHSGWGEEGEWQQSFDYFTRAWDIVLTRLQHRFEHGPIDWSNPPAAPGSER